MTLLKVKDLTVRDVRNNEIVVKNINFDLAANTCLGIVGESGSGKSMTCKALLGLTHPWLKVTGQIDFDGKNLLTVSRETLRQIRGQRIGMVLQDAMTAFDPLCTIGDQMIETLCEHTAVNKKAAATAVEEALEKMCIREPIAVCKKYPHQLSGGMLQRCMIALTIALKPDIIIADEPTTALDSINQREVVEEFQRLRELTGTALIFISHDLGIVQSLAHQVLVMRNGERVEYGAAQAVFQNPQHEYTRYLVDTRISLTQSFRDAMQKRCG
ncbi:MAG TPA: ABC transporter ATP-binding protein [Patescibacteria group bacterium]|nr:ABC transporter ATP-binding protein [Patescibacteria group bacterium]